MYHFSESKSSIDGFFFLQVAFILEGVIRYQIEKGYKWRIRVKGKFKGGLISERFSLLLKSPKMGAKSLPWVLST